MRSPSVLFLLLTLFVFKPYSAKSQRTKIDSLIGLAKTSEYPVCQRALWMTEITAAFYGLGEVDSMEFWLNQTEQLINSSGVCPKALGRNHMNRGILFSLKGDNEKALLYDSLALKVQHSIGDTIGLISVYCNMGGHHYFAGNKKDELRCYNQGIRLSEMVKRTKGLATLHVNLGVSYLNTTQFDLAIQHGLKAREYYLVDDNLSGVAWTDMLLSEIYKSNGQFERAKERARQSMDWYVGNGKNFDKLSAYLVMADVFLAAEEIDSAAQYYERTRKEAVISEDMRNYPNALIGLTEVSLKRQRYQQARDFVQEALGIFDLGGNKQQALHCHLLLAASYDGSKQYENSIASADRAFIIADSLDLLQQKMEAAAFLTKAYLATGNERQGLTYLNLERTLRDSVQKQMEQEVYFNTQIKYETKEIERENLLLQLRNDSLIVEQAQFEIDSLKSQAQEARTRIILLSVVGVLLVILLLGLIVYRAYRQKKTAAVFLEKQDAEKAVLLREIHHRVKNNLQIISSLLNLQTRTIKDDQAVKAIQESQSRVKSIALIHQKLYQTTDLSNIPIQEYIEQLTTNALHVFGSKEINMQISVQPSDLTFDVDTAVPFGLILNEFITNSFKHAFGEMNQGMVEIELEQMTPNSFSLKMKDNGIGLPHDFDVNKSNSLGFRLMKELSRQLKGDLNWTTENGTICQLAFETAAKE